MDLLSGLALFIPCDESSNGSVQVDRRDISGNGRIFTDVNTVASAVASAGHPYVNQCFPAGSNEGLSRADDTGLQIGAGTGWTVAIWAEVVGAVGVNSFLVARYSASALSSSSFALYFSSTAHISGLHVFSAAQLPTSAIAFTASKRFLAILSKATGSSAVNLNYRNFDAGSWTTAVSAVDNQTNAGALPITMGMSAQPAGWVANTRLGPLMYWPSRLLNSEDKDALFNNGSGLTLEQMGSGFGAPFFYFSRRR